MKINVYAFTIILFLIFTLLSVISMKIYGSVVTKDPSENTKRAIGISIALSLIVTIGSVMFIVYGK